MAPEDSISTDDLLEAFRRKKAEAARAAEVARASEEAQAAATTPIERLTVKPVPTVPEPKVESVPESVPEPKVEPVPDSVPAPTNPPKTEFLPSPRGPVPGSKIAEDTASKPIPEPVKKMQAPAAQAPQKTAQPALTNPAPAPEAKPASKAAPKPNPEPAPKAPEADSRVKFNSKTKTAQSKPKEDPVVDAAHRPSSPAVGARTLAPLDPALGLATRLQTDSLVSRPIWALWRYSAHGALALGLAFLLLDRYVAIVAGNVLIGPVRLTWVALTLTILAAGATGALWTLAKDRSILLNFESSQADEWVSAEFRVKLLARIRLGGLIAIGASLIFGLLFSFIQPFQNRPGVLVAMFAIAGISTLTVLGSHFMHQLAVRNYIQTTILWILERTGASDELGGVADARVPAVLKSLDGLLAQLPDSAVQSFMQTPEAKAYLELMESLTEP